MRKREQHIPTTDEFVEHVNRMTIADITPEHIRAVLDAANLAKGGEPSGTVMRDEDGKVAVRVTDHGVDQWVVVSRDGGVWRDLVPTLQWSKLADPVIGLDPAT